LSVDEEAWVFRKFAYLLLNKPTNHEWFAQAQVSSERGIPYLHETLYLLGVQLVGSTR